MKKRTPLLVLSILGLLLLLLAVASAASVNCSGVTAWVAGGNYTVGELVTYQGSEYKCLQANNNAAPNWDPVDWPGGWSLVGTCTGGPTATATRTATGTATRTATGTATRTATGTATRTATGTATRTATATATATGGGGSCYPAWNSTTAYNGGAQVSENNVNYTANYWSQGSDPATNNGGPGSGKPWTSDGSCSGSGGGGGGTPTATPTPVSSNSPLPPPGAWPSRYFAPYADMGLWPTANLASIMSASGVKHFTMAFIINSSGSTGCVASWFGAYPVVGDTTLMPVLNALRAAGGDAIISFGGAGGTELGDSCTDATSLQAQYQSVITTYNEKMIDFDVEGVAVTDTAGIDRRNAAFAGLQAANSGLGISYTLPVLPTGLTSDGVNILTSAKSHAVNVAVVNGMAMDYGSSVDNGAQMGLDATDAAAALHAQVQAAGLSATIGVTPMIGVNDINTEVFQLADATTLLNFAEANSYISRLAMWSIARDNGGCAGATYATTTCSGISQSTYQFSSIFNSFH